MGLVSSLERRSLQELEASLTIDQVAELMRGPWGGRTRSGIAVTPDSALACAAVYACVRVVSEDVAKLPLILYRRLPNGGKERATDHPLYRLMHDRPNAWMTSFEFREMLQGHLELRGNAFAFKNVVGGRLLELVPLHPDKIEVKQASDFTLSYVVRGSSKVYGPREILHLRGLSSDGVTGISQIGVAREAIGLAQATQQHGATLFGNGARPGGVLTHPGKLSKQGQDRLREEWQAAYGGENANQTAVLVEGVTWTQLGMTSEDSQFLETRKFQRSEIASFWRIPPHKIGDLEKATFSNIEQQAMEYVSDSLDPRLVRWEQRLNLDLLTPAEREVYFFEFLREALLRGDMKTRYDGYGSAVQNGWMNRNEVRVKENLNPVPGLDEFLEPLNMNRANDPRPAASSRAA